MNIQLGKLHLLIQHFIILQLRHNTFITQSLKEIHSGRETGLIDTGPFRQYIGGYTTPNDNVEYSYPLSVLYVCLCPTITTLGYLVNFIFR